MKNIIALAAYIAFIAVLNFLHGAEMTFWNFCTHVIIFFIAILIADLAEKHGWDTWSGLWKKNKNPFKLSSKNSSN